MGVFTTFFPMRLSENECYDNPTSYTSGLNDYWSGDCEYKAPVSIYNPVLIVKAPLGQLAGYNYCEQIFAKDSQETQWIRWIFSIEDIRSINSEICEVTCKLDPLKSCSWRNANTIVRLQFDNLIGNWSTTADDPRWEPYSPVIQSNGGLAGVRKIDINMFNEARDNGTEDISVSWNSGTNSYGVYVVKWLWGYTNELGSLGIVYGAFNAEQFEKFICEISSYIANNPGTVFTGIKDFNELIISARYFPSISLSAFINAGYVYLSSGLVVGNKAESSAWCLIKKNSAGFLNNYGTLSLNALSPLNYRDANKMKFLLSSKWCKVVLNTPLGVATLPIDCLDVNQLDTGLASAITKIRIHTCIDIESGDMLAEFIRGSSLGIGVADPLTTLKGPISYDVKNRFMRIQQDGELVGPGIINAFSGAIAGGAAAGPAGIIAGTAATALQTMAQPRRITNASSGYNDIKYLSAWNFSIAKGQAVTMIFLNPDTPISDSHSYSPYQDWTAQYVYNNYTTWCNQPWHGYPSFKLINCSGLSGISSTVPRYIKAQEVKDVYVYDMPRWCEEAIKQKLLEGVCIYHYA